jgi:DNA-binding NarL/FixJ family response regulator
MSSTPDPEELSPARVLLVDDHCLFSDVLALRLRSEPEIADVHPVRTLAEARTALQQWSPDLVLLDLDLAGESGLDLLQDAARGDVALPPVLMLSATVDPALAVAALRLGARGWVAKDADVGSLRTALRDVRRGRIALPERLRSAVIEELLHHYRAPQHDFLAQLTVRQREVLECLVGGLSRRETASRLFLSINTVGSHVQHMLRVSGTHSTVALVALARDLGVAPPPASGRELLHGQHTSPGSGRKSHSA